MFGVIQTQSRRPLHPFITVIKIRIPPRLTGDQAAVVTMSFPDKQAPKMAKVNLSAKKVMASVFRNERDITHIIKKKKDGEY